MPNLNSSSMFLNAPTANVQRSIFDLSSSHITTFNFGDVVPIFCTEVLPGDTFDVTTSKVVRLQTPLAPVFDNAYLDVHWFFVPNRLVWNHWKEFMGENNESAWIPETTYSMPKIVAPEGGFAPGTIADYLGIPTGVDTVPIGESPDLDYSHFPSALPFRAYALICDHFYRDQNVSDPLLIPMGDSYQTGSNGSDYITDVANGGMPFKAAKLHDYFTSALPSPQRGDPVQIPVGSFPGGDFQVMPLIPSASIPMDAFAPLSFTRAKSRSESDPYVQSTSTLVNAYAAHDSGSQTEPLRLSSSLHSDNDYLFPDNLKVSLPAAENSFVDINQLRLAFATQRMLEAFARSGSRYGEMIKAFFGVTNPDARLQDPEYLGGNRIPFNIQQVTNSSKPAAGAASFLGDVGAMSYTADVHADFVKSFTEHGYLFGLAIARYEHTYQQGLSAMWTRNVSTDFYNPFFANIGEMPVWTREIYYDGGASGIHDVFGYQEAWASYRHMPNRTSAEMRSNHPTSLDVWHFGDDYASQPYLSDDWIREDKTNVDRTLSVTSSVSNQILGDFYFNITATRPMPLFSIPGLTVM